VAGLSAQNSRLPVSAAQQFRQLHLGLQAAFGWMNAHLHEFEIGGLRNGEEFADAARMEDDPRSLDEMEVRLRNFTRESGTMFRYVYDMGDNWVRFREGGPSGIGGGGADAA
jgi:hypothetical protein